VKTYAVRHGVHVTDGNEVTTLCEAGPEQGSLQDSDEVLISPSEEASQANASMNEPGTQPNPQDSLEGHHDPQKEAANGQEPEPAKVGDHGVRLLGHNRIKARRFDRPTAFARLGGHAIRGVTGWPQRTLSAACQDVGRCRARIYGA